MRTPARTRRQYLGKFGRDGYILTIHIQLDETLAAFCTYSYVHTAVVTYLVLPATSFRTLLAALSGSHPHSVLTKSSERSLLLTVDHCDVTTRDGI